MPDPYDLPAVRRNAPSAKRHHSAAVLAERRRCARLIERCIGEQAISVIGRDGRYADGLYVPVSVLEAFRMRMEAGSDA